MQRCRDVSQIFTVCLVIFSVAYLSYESLRPRLVEAQTTHDLARNHFFNPNAQDETLTISIPPVDSPFSQDLYHVPSLGDLDGDGEMEIYVSRSLQFIDGFDADGNVLSNFPLDVDNNFGTYFHRNPLTIADLNGDGVEELIFIAGSFLPGGNRIFVVGKTGQLRPFWPAAGVPLKSFSSNPAISACVVPTACDVDGDGTRELVVTLCEPDAYSIDVIKFDGTDFNSSKFPLIIASTPSFPPPTSIVACADIDNDSRNEIITSIDGLRVINAEGSISFPGTLLIDTAFNTETPVVGDINGDGVLEIIAIGRIPDSFSPPPFSGSPFVLVVDANGNLLPGWPQPVTLDRNASAPALNDLDNDGDLEITFVTEDLDKTEHRIYVYEHTGQLRSGWPQTRPYSFFNFPNMASADLSVADIDGDGLKNILFLRKATDLLPPELAAWGPNGNMLSGFPIVFDSPNLLQTTPSQLSAVVGDLKQDGDVDVVVTTYESDSIAFSVVLNAFIQVIDFQGPISRDDWRTIHGNERRDGLLP